MYSEALPGVLGNRGTRVFISGEQGNKGQILRGTGEQRQYWGTGNIRKQVFDFWGTGEQANLFQGNKGTGTPPGRASTVSPKKSDQKQPRYPALSYLFISSLCQLYVVYNTEWCHMIFNSIILQSIKAYIHKMCH